MRTQLEGSVCGMTEPAAASDSIHPQPAASPSPSSASSIPLPCHTRSWSSSSRLQWQDYVEKQEGNMEDKQQSIHNGSIGIAHFGRGSSIVNWHQSEGNTMKILKHTLCVDDVVGSTWGSVFDCDTQHKTVMKRKAMDKPTNYLESEFLPAHTNAQLYDDNTAQQLTQEEILQLKASQTGDQFIDTLVSHSSTFDTKTEFSQEKYIKKKRAKHCTQVQFWPFTVDRLIDMWCDKDPKRIRNLRADTLSLILAFSNVQAATSVLICDNVLGLVVAATIQRTMGTSNIVYAYEGNKRPEFVRKLQYPPHVLQCIHPVALEQLWHSNITCDNCNANANNGLSEQNPVMLEIKQEAVDAAASSSSSHCDTSSSASSSPCSCSLLHSGVDALIIVGKYDPYHSLTALWRYLTPAGRFVLFDESIEPLAQCADRVRDQCINMTLCESWFRHYQVLPNRTHPHVNMAGGAGYVLAGIKTFKSSA